MSQMIKVGGRPGIFRDDQGIRLVVPVPDCGWLRIGGGWKPEDAQAWRDSAAGAVRALGLVPARGCVLVQGTVRRAARSATFATGEEVRPSLDAALDGLVAAGFLRSADGRHVISQKLTIGASTGDCGALLVLKLLGVSGG